ncbi:hypothetical protein [Streptomyces sp. NPDC048172]|uniref:hypothetical protein n=1 Tax=Streptomyces sp. NPDC048172 TaxID=3365505 RepID=UPI003724881A
MPSTMFDLDVELVESAQTGTVAPDDARELDETAGLTPTTVNTYGLGVAMCVPCC